MPTNQKTSKTPTDDFWSGGLLTANRTSEYEQNNRNMYSKAERSHQEENKVSGVQNEKISPQANLMWKRTVLRFIYTKRDTKDCSLKKMKLGTESDFVL